MLTGSALPTDHQARGLARAYLRMARALEEQQARDRCDGLIALAEHRAELATDPAQKARYARLRRYLIQRVARSVLAEAAAV
jgi:hypothetical protein